MSGSDGGALPPRPADARELKRVIEAERAGGPFLLYRDGAGALQVRALDGSPLTLGRGDAVDVPLDWDQGVSAVHAVALRLGGHWVIADEGISRNGTFVNDERLRGRRRLRDGDSLRLGHTVITFREPSAAPRQPASETIVIDDGPGVHVTDAQRRVLVALCRPYRDGGQFALPASNADIAGELVLSLDAVKTHLHTLYQSFELDRLPQNEKRVRLAERALALGLVGDRDW